MTGQAFKTVGVVVAAIAVLLLLVWLFQRRLIYLPFGQRVPPAGAILPGATDVSFDTSDGLRLGAWYVPSENGPNRGTVLVFNGNAGNRADRAPLAVALTQRGFSVLLFDYRGYGGNPGRPSERGLALDARAARDYVASRDDVDAGRLIYFGESLGAAVALELATEQPPAVLVLRSPFASMTRIGKHHYPFLPVGLLLIDRYPSIERVPGLQCPLLVVAGERDNIVPVAHSRALYEKAPQATSRFVLIEGAGHNDYALLVGERMLEEIERFWCETRPASCGEEE
jgi:fermentation-respiration switch protein FrsA (DUF1100 family)